MWGAAIVLLEEPLSRSEIDVLRKLLELREASLDLLARALGVPQTSVASVVELLRSRGLVQVVEITKVFLKTSSEGATYVEKGLPEEQIARALADRGGEAPIQILNEVLGRDVVSIGLGWARRRGWIVVEKGIAKLVKYEPLDKHREALLRYLNGREEDPKILEDPIVRELVKRKLIEVEERRIRIARLVDEDRARRLLALGEGVSHLTHELIASGRWRNVVLKPYNVEALPPRIYPGKKHPLKEFIEMIREVMYSLGFVEIEDDYVVPELWNFDALFQAQDHPSRDFHDVMFVRGSARLDIYGDVVERARAVHEHGGGTGSTGWGYRWSVEKASKLVLRSHTTAATIRYLSMHREPPVRVFIIDRVFRRDAVDARHLPEFTNFDGVVMEKNFTFRKLLGILTQILRSLGIERVKFVPSYFPFTEPSVEGLAWIEGMGWVEVLGAGMFRPEVLRIAGVEYPVGAWGMGVERLAMAVMGINDIRELYSYSVETVRRMSVAKTLRFLGV